MKISRIATRKHASIIYGLGEATYGGRWNKKDAPVLYTGKSKEIAEE